MEKPTLRTAYLSKRRDLRMPAHRARDWAHLALVNLDALTDKAAAAEMELSEFWQSLDGEPKRYAPDGVKLRELRDASRAANNRRFELHWSLINRKDGANNPDFDLWHNRVRWIESLSDKFRNMSATDEGYYVDEYQGDVTRGLVIRLNHGRFLAGITDPHNKDAALVITGDIWEDEQSAENAAARFAEHYADDQRDHSVAWQKGQEVASARAELSQLRKEVKAQIEAVRKGVSVCDTLKRLLEKVDDLRGQIVEVFDEYRHDKNLFESVNDGANAGVF